MPNKMLIDATHPEETRVVLVRGNRVEEFDFETAQRKQLRGNIYLAKVTRVEPSLQAAFVEYGGNRHGFLAFSEIHPDYYQIPVADRQALIAEEERAHREADDEMERRAGRRRERGAGRRRDVVRSEPVEHADGAEPAEEAAEATLESAADRAADHETDVAEQVADHAFAQVRPEDAAHAVDQPIKPAAGVAVNHEPTVAAPPADAELDHPRTEPQPGEPVLVVREAVEEQQAAEAAAEPDGSAT